MAPTRNFVGTTDLLTDWLWLPRGFRSFFDSHAIKRGWRHYTPGLTAGLFLMVWIGLGKVSVPVLEKSRALAGPRSQTKVWPLQRLKSGPTQRPTIFCSSSG